MSDLVERLREEDLKWQTQCDGWMVLIRNADPDKDHSETERMLRRSLSAEAASRISQQDAELDRLRREVEEARIEAFFVGWEMSHVASAEDTCAEAWEYWRLMEDGRDEAEGKR